MQRISIVILLLAPGLAHATNTRHERTPVVWQDVPCMTLVDRSAEAVLHLDYSIPLEDTMVTADEVADSRTHQFFALCHDVAPRDEPANWITQADVDAATAVGLEVTDGDDVLDASADWTSCFVRITADDARRPITFAAAMDGVDWDTTDAPAGGYMLYGYTYEPLNNEWWLRPGVVKVHDGDPAAVGPAAAIDVHGDFSIYRDEEAMLGGCIDALPGTTFAVEYRTSEATEWSTYSEDNAIDGDAFELRFTPPAETIGKIVFVRAGFEDEQSRRWVTHVDAEIVVIDAPDPEGCAGGFVGSMCGESSDSGSSSGGPATSSGSTGTAADGSSSGDAMATQGEGGCACNGIGSRSSLLLLVPLLLVRRRRAHT